ncbi:carboxymethylenebutenolidase [Lachnospiraceae bacterium]|jgi:rhodanese-related sulfurtransferase|nr:alpha/beta hydrolase [uncultured Schaedlerella sp.]MCI9154707.1 carboxymethylenebutenolidase [Ruminococcus sp.]NBI61086.1 carboxymethylenebutenolidase [Lachnospiraceae bacterium]
MKKIWNKKKIVLPLLAGVILLITTLWYVNDYYHTDENVQEYLQTKETVSVTEMSDGLYLDGPGDNAAMIFYPGAKVEYTAYLPLLTDLAEQGIDCFLIKMPCNLAFFGQNKAKKIMDSYEYDHWYLSGHSLGGAMTASYASGHLESLNGLVLLAAYPTKSLKSDSFSVLSIYGSEDGVLNMEKVEEGKSQMPADYTEICIEGGNHAQFGNYGEQKGDHTAGISREEQQKQTVDAILDLMEAHRDQKQEETVMTYEQISVQKAKERMEEEKEKDVIILDVRTQEEYDSGHIKNAVCLPNEDILSEPDILPDKGQEILVYCRSGNRSKQAAQKLADMGYENVLEFGGILDWPYPELVE